MDPDEAMAVLIRNCPEVVGILPPGIVAREDWRRLLCSFDQGFRSQFDPRMNSTFDFSDCKTHCSSTGKLAAC